MEPAILDHVKFSCLALLACGMLGSCRSVQWVGESGVVYDVARSQDDTGVHDHYKALVPDGCQKAAVTVKEDMITVRFLGTNPTKVDHEWTEPADLTLFPTAPPKKFNMGSLPNDKPRLTFRYNQAQWFVQPLTVALKFRGEAIKDSIPAQSEASFNIGFAYGYKVTKTWWHPHRNLFDQQTERISFALAPILSIGSLELTDKNTRDPKIRFARKVPLLSYGIMAGLSFNGVSIGAVRGWDKTFTKNTDGWIYEGDPWWGLVLGLDLIK